MKLGVQLETFPLLKPTKISGYTFDQIDLVVCTLEDQGQVGRGEAYGVYYLGEAPKTLAEQIEAHRAEIERGLTREALQHLLPPGGARNALDCALWDLESRMSKRTIADLAGLAPPVPVPTTRTIWGAEPEEVAREAKRLSHLPLVKLKLLGDGFDAERIKAARAELPDATLCVDANQGFDPDSFAEILPVMVKARLRMIEQPFPLDKDEWFDGLECPIPLAADESVQGIEDIEPLVGWVQMINIKLDKCGGLTEALAMARRARELGFEVMVGCMTSTSLSMAPAFYAAQSADLADLDGPLYLARDRDPSVSYKDAKLHVPPGVWGHG